EEKLADMTKQLSDKKIAMQRFAQDADRELGEARDRAMQELNQKIMPVVDQLGKEMGLAAIFNKYESGLIYASEAIDVTDVVIKRFNDAQGAPAADATPEQLSFLANPKYASQVPTTRAGAVLVATDFAGDDARLIRVTNPYLAMANVAAKWFASRHAPSGISPLASLSPSATL